jgi:hypothetical protein
MSHKIPMTPEELEIEATLGALKPAAAKASRDDLMFSAGRRAERRRLHAWQGAAGVMGVVLCLSLLIRPQPQFTERIVYLETEPAKTNQVVAQSTEQPSPPAAAVEMSAAYLQLRDAVQARGLKALQPHETSTEVGRTHGMLFLIDLPASDLGSTAVFLERPKTNGGRS